MKRVAIVTGANRGIGLEITRQLAQRGLHVVLASRDFELGRAAAEKLAGQGLAVSAAELDVTNDEQVGALAGEIERTHGGLNVLVNNAAVALNGFDADIAGATIDVNFFGPLRVTDRLLPLIRTGG